MNSFLLYITRHLLDNETVKLDNFGIFSPSLTTTPSDSPDQVSRYNIKKVNVQFWPSIKMKDDLKAAKFEKAG